MKIACISDVHATPDNSAYKILLKFLDNPVVQGSSHVLFLGDIFDLMVGDFKQYQGLYNDFFSKLRIMLDRGKKIYFFEGNHDFHLEKFYNDFDPRIVYIKDEFKLNIKGKSFLFQHGDIVDIDNKSYKRWKSIYSSQIFRKIVEFFFPFQVVTYLGDRASKNSKKRGSKDFDRKLFRNKYREGAAKIIKQHKVDYLICGHTHIKDNYKVDGACYINIGFPLIDLEYLYIDQDEISFKLIE